METPMVIYLRLRTLLEAILVLTLRATLVWVCLQQTALQSNVYIRIQQAEGDPMKMGTEPSFLSECETARSGLLEWLFGE